VRELVRAGTNLLGEPACVLIRRSVLSSAGGWIAEQPYLIDQHTYMTVLEHGDLVAVPETLAAFRISSTQWSRALAREQSAQARAVHAAFRRRHPTAISRRDVLLGDLRATRTAWARRLAYLAWSRRLRDA
jgi:hypothetical protein